MLRYPIFLGEMKKEQFWCDLPWKPEIEVENAIGNKQGKIWTPCN